LQNDSPTFVTIAFAGDKQVVTISNTDLLQRIYANRMNVAPTARMDDGLFDLLAVNELSLLQVLPKLAKLYGGRILGDPAVRHFRSAVVRIETDPPVTVQADGQVLGPTPAEFSLRPRALTVVTGPAGPSRTSAAARAGIAPRSS